MRGKGVVREGLRQGRDSVGAVAHFHKSWNRPTLKCPLAPGSLVSVGGTPRTHGLLVGGWVGGWTKCTMCSNYLYVYWIRLFIKLYF